MRLLKLLEEKKKAKLRAEKTKKAKATALGAVTGAIAGVLSGILFAPKSGKETRAQIVETSKKTTHQVKETALNVKDQVKNKAIEGKENIIEAKSRIQQYLADKRKGTKEIEQCETTEQPQVEESVK